MMWSNHAMFGGYMWVFWLAVLIAVVLVLKWILTPASPRSEPHSETPIDILRKRYARGDISKEEFEEKKRSLLV